MQRKIGAHTATLTGLLPARGHGVLLCLGSAPGGTEQALGFLAHTAADVAACNDAITTCPGALHLAASLHPELLEGWVQFRREQGAMPCIIGPAAAPGVDVVLGFDRAVASSAMYLAFIGQLMGYGRIVLAGVQLERPGEEAYRPLWRAAKAKGALDGVETLSPGWLRQLLLNKG